MNIMNHMQHSDFTTKLMLTSPLYFWKERSSIVAQACSEASFPTVRGQCAPLSAVMQMGQQ